MANKKSRSEGLKMKKSFAFFLFLALFLLSNPTFTQNISKYFSSSIQDSGTLYFIEPPAEFSNKSDRAKLVFDLTYLTNQDSVVLNFSLFKQELVAVNYLQFLSEDEKQIQSPVKKIFIDSKKNKWHHRYSAKFSFKDLKQLFHQKQKASILISLSQSEIPLQIKKNKWKKNTAILSKIFTLIEANKPN